MQSFEIKNRHHQTMDVHVHVAEQPRGIAVLQHGYPSSANCLPIQSMTEAFTEMGFTAITPNTTNNDNNSDGTLKQMTLSGHCNDLEDCIAQLNHIDGLDPSLPLILAGHSAGAHSAFVVSARLPKPPLMLLAAAPLISGEQYISGWQSMFHKRNPKRDFIEAWKKRGNIPFPSDTSSEKLQLSWDVISQWAEHDLIANDILPTSPTAIIIGESDELTPSGTTFDYFMHAKISDLLNIPDADHGFTGQKQSLRQATKRAIGFHLNR